MLNNNKISKDRQCWEDMLSGNEEAFAIIYKRYSYALSTYGSKISKDEALVKDAMQDVFINLWNKRTQLPKVENVRLYLFKSLRNRLLRILQTQPHFDNRIEPELPVQRSPEFSIILEELKKEQLLKLHFHLDNLPARQREAIHLKFFQKLKTSEIADLLDIKYQSVSNLLFKGLNTLRVKLSSSNVQTSASQQKKTGNI